MKISVSILREMNDFENSINKLNETSSNYLHLDVMDGSFTQKITFSFEQSKKIKELSQKELDVHIMSTNLDSIIDKYIELSPSFITFHIENNNISKYIDKIKQSGIKVGLAINPDTSIDKIIPYLDNIDLVLVMSVVPGESGQKFMLEVLPKLQELYELKNKYNYVIEIDGGINDETIKYVKDFVDILVVGSYITNSSNYQDKIEMLENSY